MDIIQEKSTSEVHSHIKRYNKGMTDFHWHKKVEICRPVNKACRFLINGKIFQADKGDVLCIEEQIVHSFLCDYDDTDVRIIQFPIKLLLNIDSSISPIKPHISLDEIKKVEGLNERLEILFNLTEQEGEIASLKDAPYVQSLYSAIYFLLMRSFPDMDNKNVLGRDAGEFFKITEYINANFRKKMTFNDIALNTLVSRRKLPDLFFKYSGRHLNEYIDEVRIKNVNSLLRNGSNITEAAFESGFQSIRTFNTAYKKCMKCTPSEYVKENIESKRDVKKSGTQKGN